MNKNFIHNFNKFMFPKKLLGVIILAILVVPCFALAAGGTLENPLKPEYGDFAKLIDAVLDIMIKFGTPIAALFIVYAGFMFVTSRGDPKKLETAQTMFVWTLAGTALIVGAKIVYLVVAATIAGITK